MYITRHEILRNVSPERVSKTATKRSKYISSLEKSAVSMDLFLDPILGYAQENLILDPEAARLETWEAWVATMQYAHAMFMVTMLPAGTEVECMIDHKARRITATGPRYFANASNWELAFYLALTCRDEKRVRDLCNIPVEFLRECGESDGTRYNEFTYHWIAALQSYILNDQGLVEHLGKALEFSDPRAGAFGGEALDMLIFPQIDLFRCLLKVDSEEFNSSLTQGLEWFKIFHESNERNDGALDSVVPLGLLAISCVAYDLGYYDSEFRLEVESDYLPKYILDRGWVGEFPV